MSGIHLTHHRGAIPGLIFICALLALTSQAAFARPSLSGLQQQIDQIDQRLTACEQGIAGACPGSAGPEGPAGPPGPPGPAADAKPPIPPVIGAAFIDGFKGDSAVPAFHDAFDIRSLKFAAARSSSLHSGQAQSAGQVSISDVSITINDGGQVPALYLAAARGNQITDVRIVLTSDSGGKGNDSLMELLLRDVLLTRAQSLPATRPGDASVVEFDLNFVSIEITNASNRVEFNLAANTGSTNCPMMDFEFALSANDPGGKGDSGVLISGLDFQITNSSAGGATGGGGGGKSTLSPLTIHSGYFVEALCLFGAVISGVELSVQVNDPLKSGGGTQLSLDEALVSKFELSSDPNGEVQVHAEFDYRKISWQTTAPDGSNGPPARWSPATNSQF